MANQLFSLVFAVVASLFPVLCAAKAKSAKVLIPILILYLPALASFLFLSSRKHFSKLVDKEMLVRIFVGGFCPGVLIALFFESLLTVLFAMLFLGDQFGDLSKQMKNYKALHPKADMQDILTHLNIHKTIGFFLFLFAMAFIVAAFVEEAIKLWTVHGRCSSCCWKKKSFCQPKSTIYGNNPVFLILCMGAAGLGFSTVENIGYTLQTTSFSDQLTTSISRSLISTPLHVVCALISGVGLAGKECIYGVKFSSCISYLGLLLPAVFLHGIFDFLLFLNTVFVTPHIGSTMNLFISLLICIPLLFMGGCYLRLSIRKLDLPSASEQWLRENSLYNDDHEIEKECFLSDDQPSIFQTV